MILLAYTFIVYYTGPSLECRFQESSFPYSLPDLQQLTVDWHTVGTEQIFLIALISKRKNG